MLVTGRATVCLHTLCLPELCVPCVLWAGHVMHGEAWRVCPGPRTQDDVIRYSASWTCSFGRVFLTAGTSGLPHSSPGSRLSPWGPCYGGGQHWVDCVEPLTLQSERLMLFAEELGTRHRVRPQVPPCPQGPATSLLRV